MEIVILMAIIGAIVFFFKRTFSGFVYSIAVVDIFLRIITYLKANILRDDAFSFLGFIPADIPTIIRSFDMGIFVEILIGIYIIMYIVFEILLIKLFINRKF